MMLLLELLAACGPAPESYENNEAVMAPEVVRYVEESGFYASYYKEAKIDTSLVCPQNIIYPSVGVRFAGSGVSECRQTQFVSPKED